MPPETSFRGVLAVLVAGKYLLSAVSLTDNDKREAIAKLSHFYQSDISPDGILYLGDADELVSTVGTR